MFKMRTASKSLLKDIHSTQTLNFLIDYKILFELTFIVERKSRVNNKASMNCLEKWILPFENPGKA